MGLDVALGVVILIAAIRGWLQGFVYQAIRIGGLVACVYLADPVRDQAKPHVLRYLPTIQPEVMDRILWWVAAASELCRARRGDDAGLEDDASGRRSPACRRRGVATTSSPGSCSASPRGCWSRRS